MDLIYIPILLIGWVAYLLSTEPSNAWLTLLLVGTVFAAFMIRAGWKKTAAANNAVFAAATFQTLTPFERANVETKASEILTRLRRPLHGPDMMNHSARWGWYALAMRELGIAPLEGLPNWNLVRNPLLALASDDEYLLLTIERVKLSGHPVDISLFKD